MEVPPCSSASLMNTDTPTGVSVQKYKKTFTKECFSHYFNDCVLFSHRETRYALNSPTTYLAKRHEISPRHDENRTATQAPRREEISPWERKRNRHFRSFALLALSQRREHGHHGKRTDGEKIHTGKCQTPLLCMFFSIFLGGLVFFSYLWGIFR